MIISVCSMQSRAAGIEGVQEDTLRQVVIPDAQVHTSPE